MSRVKKAVPDDDADAKGIDEVVLPSRPDDPGSDKHSRFVNWSSSNPTSMEKRVAKLLGSNPWGFKTQQELHGYVVDFYAPEYGLVIEADGPEHIWGWEADLRRDEILASHGIKTLRLTPGDFVTHTDQMLFDLIEELCDVRHTLKAND